MRKIDFRRLYKWEENGVTYNAFVSRINSWWTREEAVQFQRRKLHREKYESKRKIDPSWYIIDIKYSNEEANVFACIYEEIIHEIENQYYATDEPQEAQELIKKKKELERQYDIFLNAQL